MLKSMTAFGRASECINGKEITLEIKSVNNRFADYAVRVPRTHAFLEEKIKAYLQMRGISRGKIEVNCTVNVLESAGTDIHLDAAYAESYLRALRELRDRFCLTDDISVMTVAQNRDLFIVKKPEEDAERDWAELLPVLSEAVSQYNSAREREGNNLRADLLAKKNEIAVIAEKIAELSEANTRNYREKLIARLKQTLDGLDIEFDGNRILTECAIFADRTAVDEELVRLKSHFDAFDAAMNSSEPVGRRLDFLLQEMNREVNTTGSKSNDAEIAALVVDARLKRSASRFRILSDG